MGANPGKIAAGLAAIAAILLAVLAFPDQIYNALRAAVNLDRHDFQRYYDLILYVLFTIVLIIIPALCLLSFLRKMLVDSDLVHAFQEVNSSPCNEADLRKLAALAVDEFGPRASALETIQRLVKHSPASHWKVEAGGEIIGYFVLFSLTKAGERAIQKTYYNGASPSSAYLHRDIRKGKAVCVGGIVGIGRRGRASTLAALTTAIRILRYERVYGKAITPDGLRLVKKFKFVRVDGVPECDLNHYYVGRPGVA